MQQGKNRDFHFYGTSIWPHEGPEKGGSVNTILKQCLAGAAVYVLAAGSALAVQHSQYDLVTSSQAIAAKENLKVIEDYQFDNNRVDMYSAEQMNRMIEESKMYQIIRDRDHCQFTPDIEDRARLVSVTPFMYAWGDMLIHGFCVDKDEALGLKYMQKAADKAYAPAMERLAFYYEKGILVNSSIKMSEKYMRAAALLGSKNGRLGWADMLVRGYGSPSFYEEAFSWLYHTVYDDPYSRLKQEYLQKELQKRMPPDVIARDIAYVYDY